MEKYSEKPDDVEEAENTYTYLEIDVSTSDEEIQNTSIEFSVNRSFAENHDIVLSRHHNQVWNDLPTRPVEQEGEKWIYKASSTGFSYYAVKGTEKINNQEEQQEQDSQNNGTTEANQTSQQENQPSNETEQDSDNQNVTQTQENRDKVSPIVFIPLLILIGILGITGYFVRERRKP